ncbi:MAG: hypothetical protein IJN97_07345, partial [Oscillospiraceae bacterium]|nr:hypothetical protein [Oscillospiraceae bacterium]
MTNSKATKKALFMSMLSLLLCFTMLMGATFAWFTDTVTSKNNRIVAGNLDVDLVMYKEADGKYVSIAGGNGDIFSEAEGGNGINWEPGKTEIVYLGVRNLGSLALKYNIALDIVDDVFGEGGLIGSLEYAILDGVEVGKDLYNQLTQVRNWETLKTIEGVQVGDVKAGVQFVADKGTLDEIVNGTKEETDYFALAVHMKEEATNEYQNGSIQIDVIVNATQKDAEEDSFDSTYDKDVAVDYSEVSSLAMLKAALANKEETIVLTSDIEVPETYTIDYNVTINGAGKEISRAD